MKTALWLVAVVAALGLSACSTPESRPSVSVRANPSGFVVSAPQIHGPEWLLGAHARPDGTWPPFEIPSGVRLRVDRPRDAGGGVLDVVSVEHPHAYEPALRPQVWKRWLQTDDLPLATVRESLWRAQEREIPLVNAGRAFHVKLRRRHFEWGDAVFFLTTYVQGRSGAPVNNQSLALVMQGLTRDGRFAVRGLFEISHPQLPKDAWETRRRGRMRFSLDDEAADAARWLEAQPDHTFRPAMDDYEQLCGALVIQPERR